MASAPSPWPTIHAERAALAEDLARLNPTQWASPSLCGEWTVQQCVGHMVATARLTPPSFVAALVRARFRFGVMGARHVERYAAGTPADTLDRFRRIVTAKTSPPGPVDSWLGETIVHAEDVRRPLGIAHDYPIDAVVRCLDFFKGSNLLIGSKTRIAGVTLRATDADWSTGEGPEVAGPALSLLMAMTGRTVATADLTGPGVSALA